MDRENPQYQQDSCHSQTDHNCSIHPLITREFPTWKGGGESREPSVARRGAMMAADEAPSPSACRLQDAIPSCVGDPVSAENPRAGLAEYCKKVLRDVREFQPDWFIAEVGVDRDHVHLHMVIPPKYTVSKVVETLKSVTSRRIKEKFPHVLAKVYWDGGGSWARGFFASTVGINEATIQQYVRHQGEQETGQAQLEL